MEPCQTVPRQAVPEGPKGFTHLSVSGTLDPKPEHRPPAAHLLTR